MSRLLKSHRHDDRGVVALELVLLLPIIIGLLVTSITFAGLFQTQSRVVGAARDGARSLALGPARLPLPPIADPNPGDPPTGDGITVVLVSPACPPLTDIRYRSTTPPKVTAEASITYDVIVPFVGEWTDIPVTEKVTMPCG